VVKPVKYIAITPARDEEAFLPEMINSMMAQTIPPSRWIIINDGSNDRTGEIIDQAARKYRCIEPNHLPAGHKRHAGGESVIMRFLPEEVWRDADFIVRFDADLWFDNEYVEKLLREFERNPKLGIASGWLMERIDGEWKLMPTARFHTRGASKVYSRRCFAAIGGLEAGLGWDTIDEIRAQMSGFETRSFPQIVAYHRRPAGSATGAWRGRYLQGRVAYYVGYSPLYAIARAVPLLFRRPLLLGSLMYLAGFGAGYLHRLPQVDRQLIEFIREQQLRRLTFRNSVWQ
jgi:biofilm PGA synthesis N-glycosyltransferase PgaC